MRDRWPPRPVVRASSGLSTLETVLGRAGLGPVAGIDEAGRGACAGPMTVAACILPKRIPASLGRLDDSKKLTENAREQLYPKILELAVSWSVVSIPAPEIDRIGVHVANIMGMRRAVAGLQVRPGYVLIDGFTVPGLGIPSLPVIGGDAAVPVLHFPDWETLPYDRFSPHPDIVSQRLATLHLALSDASGDSAIVEYIDGEQVIHHGREFQVMTNSPIFDKQLAISEYWKEIGGTVMLPGTNRAADRFVRASFYIDAVPKTADPLEAVAVALGVLDPRSSTHALREAGINDAGVTCGIGVHQCAGDHPGNDFGIRMMVGIESMSG